MKKWHEYHCRDEDDEQWRPREDIVSKVRLTLMSLNDLLKTVRHSNLFDLNLIMDAIDSINDEKQSILTATDENVTNINKDVFLMRTKKYRGRLRLDENIATKAHHAQVIEGEMKHALLDGDVSNYDLDRGFTRHPIDDVHNICVKLDGLSIINHIKMLLWDKDTRAYSYYVEVSVDDMTWTRIVDYRAYLCRSWQKLFFAPVVASSIRVVGTHNTVNKVFHLVSMEVYYTQKPFALVGDLYVPINNVATLESSAVVSEGVSRVRNALINGDYHSYDWDSGYTCHQLGSGGIVIQLSQPYVVSSMRLLLWDCDNRSYSYYIETSYDNINWSKAVDKQTVACRSWEILTFSPRIVVYIRICGTHNTANEVFHCVHFECPCRPDVLQSYLKEQSSISTTDEHETNSVTFEEFSKYTNLLIDASIPSSSSSSSSLSSSVESQSALMNPSILPFTSKPGSMGIYALETSI